MYFDIYQMNSIISKDVERYPLPEMVEMLDKFQNDPYEWKYFNNFHPFWDEEDGQYWQHYGWECDDYSITTSISEGEIFIKYSIDDGDPMGYFCLDHYWGSTAELEKLAA